MVDKRNILGNKHTEREWKMKWWKQIQQEMDREGQGWYRIENNGKHKEGRRGQRNSDVKFELFRCYIAVLVCSLNSVPSTWSGGLDIQ